MLDGFAPKQSHSLKQSLRISGRRVAMCLLLVFLAACNKPAPPVGQFVEGQAFPLSVLEFISNRKDATPSLEGKMLVLNIWATWCPPCRREMPSLDRLSKILDPQRFAVIGLSTDEDALLASEFLLQYGITFANFFDQNTKMSRELGLKVYPVTFVIAPDRTLLRRMTGLYEWDSPEIVSMLEGLYQSQQTANRGFTNVLR